MIAIDTNVLVRFIVTDDARQAERARTLIERNDILIPTSVVLETEWVLRGTYEYGPDKIARGLGVVLGLPRVSLGEPEIVRRALSWLQRGMDFADALHLAASGEAEGFATFDKALIRTARRLKSPIDVIEP